MWSAWISPETMLSICTCPASGRTSTFADAILFSFHGLDERDQTSENGTVLAITDHWTPLNRALPTVLSLTIPSSVTASSFKTMAQQITYLMTRITGSDLSSTVSAALNRHACTLGMKVQLHICLSIGLSPSVQASSSRSHSGTCSSKKTILVSHLCHNHHCREPKHLTLGCLNGVSECQHR
jgi:hypothetical protein